jgi:small subunit ribosomal protein S17
MSGKRANNMEQQTKKRKIIGVVVSDKMAKTRVVAVSSLKKHPKYLKYYKVTTKFKAHDENNEYKTGDTVTIEEARPMSREKRWRIIGKITTK